MKIKQLDLLAFAHFTERALDFENGNFHIVYGPNEAGKSSSLRALKVLLFGFDARTTDNFLHDHTRLRIGGWLENLDGAELNFVRRKGNKNTLLTPEGDILDDRVLDPFLSGISREMFSSLFGLDLQNLQQGGEEILQQKGELGQMLFSAAIGSQALHGVLGELTEEADQLFRPRGSTQKINHLLKEHRAQEKAIRDSSRSANQWTKQRKALDKTTSALAAIESELSTLRKEVNRLERIQRSLPRLAQRRDLQKQLAELADVIVLAEDFSSRYRKTQSQLETANAYLQQAEPRLERLVQQQALGYDSAVISQTERIAALYSQLEQYRQGVRDLPTLLAESRQNRMEAESRLRSIRPDLELEGAEELRRLVTSRQLISEMAQEKLELDSRIRQMVAEQRKIEVRLKNTEDETKALPPLVESEALRVAVAQARKAGDIDRVIAEMGTELLQLQQQASDELIRLGLENLTLDELPRLPTPDRERISDFEKQFMNVEQNRQRFLDNESRINAVLRESLLRIEEIQRSGAVPTETELQQTRLERDALWRLIRRQWLKQEDISADLEKIALQEPLPDRFEERLAAADDIADRLRREAKRVHELVDCQLKQEDAQRQLNENENGMHDLDRERDVIEQNWRSLWSGVHSAPGTPAEMQNWLGEVARLREQIRGLQQLQSRHDDARKTRQRYRHELARSWQGKLPLPESELLGPLLQICEDRLEEIESQRRQREVLEKEKRKLQISLDELGADKRDAEKALARWNDRWQLLVKKLRLPLDTTPSLAGSHVQAVQELFQYRDEVSRLQIRIESINAMTREFQQEVEQLVPDLDPALSQLPLDEAVMKLYERLVAAQKKQAQQKEIEQQVVTLSEEIEASRQKVTMADQQLQALVAEAHCEKADELELRQQQSDKKSGLMTRLEDLETVLLEYGQGVTLDILEKEVEAIDRDSLPGEIITLQNRIDNELEPHRTELAESRGREEKALEMIDGGDQAAVLADQAQATLAAIRAEAEKYIRVKLAGRILHDEIDRYRQENQGPLVSRANGHFATLTLGSFNGLKTDFNDKDEPILVGVRPDGAQVDVAGMSSGTRDQLYLALRLASLEKYMEAAEPMPFIVDDILVDFDDQRSEAALTALGNLAEKTQVILFTHHASVVAQAESLGSDVNVLEL